MSDAEEIYGYYCEIELNGNEFISKKFVGTEASARRKCMMVTRARRVVSMAPYTRSQWNASFGNPDIRSRFC